MNWKQLYTLSTPHERLELLCRMLRILETRLPPSASRLLPSAPRLLPPAHWITAST